MKITKDNILVYDIETIKSFFLISVYAPSTDSWWDFSINQYQNDLYAFLKWVEGYKEFYQIGFNNLGFDAQVMEFIYRENEKWVELTSLEIAYKIWEFSQKVIDDLKYGLFPPYREEELSFKQLDVFKIQHFDNKNRMVGLKRLEYEMDAVNIEDMGVEHTKESFTEEERDKLIHYCHNDVAETHHNYKYIIGEVENTLYKDNNQIEIREALSEEFGFNCLNWSNSKYGDEIIKTLYCRETGVNYWDLPKRGTFMKELIVRRGIPSFIRFYTPELQSFVGSLRNKKLGLDEEFEENVKFKGQQYTFALGGLHNKIENKRYDSDDEWIIKDVDVTGYYVATIINNGYAPYHLDKRAFIKAYTWVRDERGRIKPLGKTDKKMKGVAAGYKEAGVSVYGKLGDMTNWLYDPQARLNVCIAGELSILMLIEAQEMAGHACIMANTDGATFYIRRDEEAEFNELCNKWMETTGYELEFKDYEKLYFLTVNDYIAVDTTGEVKKKGDFLTDTELHKNKSFRVKALALEAYFVHGIDPQEFIEKYDNIFNFCARNSAGQSFYHQKMIKGIASPLPRVVRYYVAKDGYKIMKMVKEGNDTGARDTKVSPAEYPKVVVNSLPVDVHKEHLQNINRQWYIDEVKKITFRIENGRKPKTKKINPNQISMF